MDQFRKNGLIPQGLKGTDEVICLICKQNSEVGAQGVCDTCQKTYKFVEFASDSLYHLLSPRHQNFKHLCS